MATPTFICGFECGVEATNAHVDQIAGTGFSISTSVVRAGPRSGRVNLSAGSCRVQVNCGTPTVLVARFYLYFNTLPNDSTYIAYVGQVSNASLGLAYNSATGKFHCAERLDPFTTKPQNFAGSGVTMSTGAWYRVDLKIDQTPGAKKCDAQITLDDGLEAIQTLTQATNTQTGAADIFYIGSRTSIGGITGEWFYDDMLISATGGDYPVGPGFVNIFVPTADGTHNIAGADDFERGNTGTDITNATTDAYLLVDDVPLPTTTSDADSIRATAPPNATDYVEVKFGPGPGISTPTDGPAAIHVLVAYHAGDNINTGNIRLAINDNGTTDDVVNYTGIAAVGLSYSHKVYSNPPSAASVWNANNDGSDGDFRDLRMRFYSSDAAPDQYFDGVIIEAEFTETDPPEEPPTGGYYACAGTLPRFESPDEAKIQALRDLRAAGTSIGQVFEMAKVSWPSPDGDIYYSVLQTDEVATVAPSVTPIETRLIPDGNPDWFLPVQMDSTIGDEEVDLEFWDGDGVFSDLIVDHGEGIKVELFYWFPEVELLLPIWHGHLRQEDDAEIDKCKVKAVQGFRSSDALLPRRAHYRECQAIFGGVFDTQDEIDELTDCPYNKHLGGSYGTNDPDTGLPWTFCPRRNRQDCIDRLGNNANYMLSHATVSVTIPNGQTHGPLLYSTSNGNETNLKDPVPVVLGTHRVHNMPVMVGRKDFNNNHPDDAWYVALYEACEGPVDSITKIRVTVKGETKDPADPRHLRTRNGTVGQTPADVDITIHSYSSTAHIWYGFGWLNPADMGDADASASAVVVGLNDIRIYTDEETYTEEWTDNRAWHIMRMLTDKRWGFGYDYARLDIPSFIEAACWCANVVQFVDTNGDEFDHIRALSHVQLNGRKVQQQIEDMCLAGRLSRPFLFNGKIHIVPLREMTDVELAAAPVFTDEGSSRNIIQDEIGENVFRTTLKRSRISDLDLPNRVECTINDAEDDYAERPLRPVEDIDAQLRAGRVVGDFSKKQNIKKYPLAGVVVEGQGFKMAWSLLDVGPFDEGGLQNNLELKFKIWFMDALDLYPTRVIKVESTQITRYGFDYFRVKNIKRMADLTVELTVQAYNADWYETFETLFGSIDPIPTDPDPPTTGTVDPPTDPLVFTTVNYTGGILNLFSEATP